MTFIIWLIWYEPYFVLLIKVLVNCRVWYSHVTVNVILITANVITNNWHFNQSINYITFRFKWYNSRLSLMDRSLWWCNQYHNQSTFTWQGFHVTFWHDIKLRSKLCCKQYVYVTLYVGNIFPIFLLHFFWIVEVAGLSSKQLDSIIYRHPTFRFQRPKKCSKPRENP